LKYFKIADFVLAACFLVLATLIYLIRPDGGGRLTAFIKLDGKTIYEINLTDAPERETDLTIVGAGRFKSVISYRKGEIYFKESDCPDKLCLRFGHLKTPGAFAACVPNRLTVEIVSDAPGGADIVSQ